MNQQDFFNRYRYDIDTDELGGGGFGTVYKAFDDERNRYVAIKVSPVKKGLESLSLLKEVQLAEQLPGHRNIGHYEACHRFKTPHGTFDYGILQYYPEGNLSDLIEKHKLNNEQKKSIALGIVSGLDHLHQHNIVHRDLKSSNILMAKGYKGEYVPKIADFGLSKQFDTTDQSYFSNSFAGGSLLYVAPEQLASGQIRKNVDLWGLGVVLFELFTGQVPFRPMSDIGTETARAEIVSRISKAQIPKSIDTIPKKWRDVVKACLVANPTQRIKSAGEIQKILVGKKPINSGEETVISPAQQKNLVLPKPAFKLPQWSWYLLGGVVLAILGMLLWPVIGGQQSIPTLTPFEEEGIYGYKDENGVIVTPARYDSATEFGDGRAKVSVGDSIYYINEEGEIIELIKPDRDIDESIKRDSTESKRVEEKFSKSKEKEDSEWNTSKRKNTKDGYEKYIRDYPNGRHVKDAKSRIQQFEKAAKPVLSPIISRLEQNMIYVKGGAFMMGCTSEQHEDCNSDEKPAHEVSISDYYIGKYEVTQEEWRTVMGSDPERLGFKGCDRCPVESVSWNDIQSFIRKLNKLSGKEYRLPSEAEWEYASRGGSKSIDYKYSGSDELGEVRWYNTNYGSKTHKVGQKEPNELGLFDLSGNVWEWCSDWYGWDYYKVSSSRNPKGPSEGVKKVLRGGSWSSLARSCRVSDRVHAQPTDRDDNIGFRLSRAL